MATTATISLRAVSKWYGDVIGVNEVSLELEPGITGLLGPNGSGKSTLMKLITGQLLPSLGEVSVLGRSVSWLPSARRPIGFLPEVDAFYEEMTGRQFVRVMARLSGLTRSEAIRSTEVALERTGMASRGDKALRACSKGMRQRIKLAQALVHDPLVLILDEPLTGIDPPGRVELMALFRALRDEGKTILVSTHILHEVQDITDRIVLMAKGRMLAHGTLGKIRELMEEHPLTVRISCTRRREIGARLLGRESVVGVAFGDEGALRSGTAEGAEPKSSDDGDLIVKVRRPSDFFRDLTTLFTEVGADVERVEPLDASVEAVFRYLVSGSGFEASEGGA